uniref:Uncharacterized protein n=1 Tax=Candidatus Kentrum sp. TC TaxID=2126339 RepID=A0A450ZMK1_9GAMM|nr:MAG: hypothetical protein BECKTC1821D_GA0114238_100937 [Candidatus Kentron sp. TC]VFK55001.1 MAG: hypothetical protein BECKTC1821F_GA0114240_100645 [Candidatus Kentron sp. TC]
MNTRIAHGDGGYPRLMAQLAKFERLILRGLGHPKIASDLARASYYRSAQVSGETRENPGPMRLLDEKYTRHPELS